MAVRHPGYEAKKCSQEAKNQRVHLLKDVREDDGGPRAQVRGLNAVETRLQAKNPLRTQRIACSASTVVMGGKKGDSTTAPFCKRINFFGK